MHRQHPPRPRSVIELANRQSSKALGRNAGGISIGSSRLSKSCVQLHDAKTDGDTRRNLYVLGLPLDLTKSEFVDIFASFGTVTHAVILATVDSSSRRRGFIVMSTHGEARAAMNALSRTQIRGHVLDVSWAVVQRSRGFLDGGDRSLMLSTTLPSPTMGLDTNQPNELLGICSAFTDHPTSRLLVSNLPTFLFTQVSDLQPLFYPFGSIKKLGILPCLHDAVEMSTAAVVEYFDVSSAREAKEALQSQRYAGHTIEVRYVFDNPPVADNQVNPSTSRPTLVPSQAVQRHLNPFATPFPDPKHSSVTHFERPQLDFPSRTTLGTPAVTPPLVPNHFPRHASDTIYRLNPTTGLNWNQERTTLPLSLNRVNDTHPFVT